MPDKQESVLKTMLRREWAFVVVGIVGIVYSVLCYFDLLNFTVCPSKLIYHIPCPSCGTTRALMRVLHGDVIGGILFNPNVILLIIIILGLPLAFWYRYTRCPDFFKRVDKFIIKPWVLIPFAIFEISIWIHNVMVGM